jgi:biopolymer transport protein ExbB
MMDLFLKGGPLMIPLFLGSLFMLTIIIERIIVFSKTGFKPEKFNSIIENLKSGKTDNALKALSPDSTVIGGFLRKTIENLKCSRELLENELSIFGDGILEKLEKHLHLLSLTGRISPMVGLLGTVMGMVEAFYTVASAKGTVEPSLLADGIWSALITTVAGLFVGIPALIAHSLFEARLNSVAFKMKHYSDEIIAVYGREGNDRV